MSKIALPKVLKIARLCHNFLYRENIIIFLGKNGALVSAFLRGQILARKFIPSDLQDDISQYRNFFNEFKEFPIFLLIDDSISKISHVTLPMLQSLVQTNPIEGFIKEYFTQDDIVAYNVHDITKQPSELWRAIIASAEYTKPISTIVEHILGNNFKFGGIYHSALELQIIIDKILDNIGKSCPEDLQIFVTILQSSGIKLVIKYKANIIEIKTFEYPIDKSDEYIQGSIEQIINDNLLLLKNDIELSQLQVSIIFLLRGNLNVLLKQSNLNAHQLIFLSNEDLLLGEKNIASPNFSDQVIMRFFASQKNFLAFNSDLRRITKLNIINLFIFKPFIILIGILLFSLFSAHLKILKNHHEYYTLSAQAYEALEEYRNIKNRYPYIRVIDKPIENDSSFSLSNSVSNINIADLYSIDALLKIPIAKPFNLVEVLLLNEYCEVTITKIAWELKPNGNILALSKHKMKTIVLLNFVTKKITDNEAMAKLHEYLERLQKELASLEYNITVQENKMTNIASKLTVPILITITNYHE